MILDDIAEITTQIETLTLNTYTNIEEALTIISDEPDE